MRFASRAKLTRMVSTDKIGTLRPANTIGWISNVAVRFVVRGVLAANGRTGSASVTAAIGLRGCLRLLRTEMMTALVFGFLLSL